MDPDADLDRDVDYLRDVQYRNSTELAKRANLHVKYRTAPMLAFDWLAAQVDWPHGRSVLDVGCGSGLLWEHVASVAPADMSLTLVGSRSATTASTSSRPPMCCITCLSPRLRLPRSLVS